MTPCSHSAPSSCRKCDGTSRDEWQREKLADEAMRQREHLLKTSFEFRTAWIESFPPVERAVIAVDADRRYGRLAAPAKAAA